MSAIIWVMLLGVKHVRCRMTTQLVCPTRTNSQQVPHPNRQRVKGLGHDLQDLAGCSPLRRVDGCEHELPAAWRGQDQDSISESLNRCLGSRYWNPRMSLLLGLVLERHLPWSPVPTPRMRRRVPWMADMQGGIFFMATSDRRSARRISVQLDVVYRKAGPIVGQPRYATTLDVGVGGACFRTADDSLRVGMILEVELRVQPRAGVLETGGSMTGLAQVLRTQPSPPAPERPGPDKAFLIAVKFCRRPTLSAVQPSETPRALEHLDSGTRHIHTTVCCMPG